jgi:hypothetical protein
MPTPHDRWTAILRDFDSSGLTAARFCAGDRETFSNLVSRIATNLLQVLI